MGQKKRRQVSVRAYEPLRTNKKPRSATAGRSNNRPVRAEDQDDDRLSIGDIEAMLSDDDPLKLMIHARDQHLPGNGNFDTNQVRDEEEEELLPEQFDSVKSREDGGRRAARKQLKPDLERLPVLSKDRKKWSAPLVPTDHSSDDEGDEDKDQLSSAQRNQRSTTRPPPKTLEEKQAVLSGMCLALTQDPQKNLAYFTRIRKGWKGQDGDAEEGYSFLRDPKVAALAMASLVALFVDILPGYPIRRLSEAEKTEKLVSKDVRRQRAYEQGLLHHWDAFLRLLRDALGYPARELDAKGAPAKKRNKAAAKAVAVDRAFLGNYLAPLAQRLGHFNHAEVVVGWAVREVPPWP